MMLKQYDSEALKLYRQKAAEILELRTEVGQKVSILEPPLAQKELDKLNVSTQELYKFRDGLEPHDRVMATYSIMVINEHTLSFVLPQGCSRIEILQETQGLVTERNLICKQLMQKLAYDPRFTRPVTRAERLYIDGHVQGSKSKTLAEQEQLLTGRGLEIAAFEDLAVAFALCWVSTKQPLFGWVQDLTGVSPDISHLIRAGDSSLIFDCDGLDEMRVEDTYNNIAVAVSARMKSFELALSSLSAA